MSGRTNTRAAAVALFLAAMAALALATLATAQSGGWTVQVMALRDYREAQAVVESLEVLGYDAYGEFAMHQGQQYVRIRIGCFAGRTGADQLAGALSSVVTSEAVVVPITPGADIDACVEVEIGFLKPANWRQLATGSGRFEVVVGGESAMVTHTGERWAVVQDPTAAPPSGGGGSRRFSQASLNGVMMVQTRTASGTFNLCPGHLLAEVAEAAIVERPDAVVACRLLGITGGRP